MKTILKISCFSFVLFLFTSCSSDEDIELNNESEINQEIRTVNSKSVFSENNAAISSPLLYETIVNINASSCGNGNISVPFKVYTRSENCSNLLLHWTHEELAPYYLSGNWEIKINLKWKDIFGVTHSEVLDLNSFFDYYATLPFSPPNVYSKWFFSPEVPDKFKFIIALTNTDTGCVVNSAIEFYNVPCN